MISETTSECDRNSLFSPIVTSAIVFLCAYDKIEDGKIMTFSSELPERCKQCAKSAGPILNRKCRLCRELEFDECVLCDLNRLMQNPLDFKCQAHQPILTVTNSSEIKTPDFSGGLNGINRQKSFLKYLRSDKIKS